MLVVTNNTRSECYPRTRNLYGPHFNFFVRKFLVLGIWLPLESDLGIKMLSGCRTYVPKTLSRSKGWNFSKPLKCSAKSGSYCPDHNWYSTLSTETIHTCMFVHTRSEIMSNRELSENLCTPSESTLWWQSLSKHTHLHKRGSWLVPHSNYAYNQPSNAAVPVLAPASQTTALQCNWITHIFLGLLHEHTYFYLL